jgi:hypothetical protein
VQFPLGRRSLIAQFLDSQVGSFTYLETFDHAGHYEIDYFQFAFGGFEVKGIFICG